jgi:hypothetical protein
MYQEQPEGLGGLAEAVGGGPRGGQKIPIHRRHTPPDLKNRLPPRTPPECQAKIKSITREIAALYSHARRSVMTEVIIPGQKKLFEKVTGKPWETLADEPKREVPIQAAPSADMQAAGAADGARTMVPADGKTKPTKAESAEAEIKAWSEEATYYAIPRRQWRDYFRSRAQQSRQWLRAAELESPAPRGHYLREFGQSDREMIENSNQ